MIIHLFLISITTPILNILVELYALLGDLGSSIVVLTILVCVALSPAMLLRILRGTTQKQDIQSQIEKINRKYPFDHPARERAKQALLRQRLIGTSAGCLIMLLQLIVLIGLYRAISDLLSNTTPSAINGLLYPFVPHFHQLPNRDLNWFTFLNPTWHYSLAQPDPSRTLPIFAGIFTAVQVRLQFAIMEKDQTISERLAIGNMCVATLLTILFGWVIAAGIVLYWVTVAVMQGTLATIILLRRRRRHTLAQERMREE